MNYKIVAHTDIGIRKSKNQDSVLLKVAQTDYGNVAFCAICDGMGGLEKGELASATLVRILSKWFDNEFPGLLYQGLNMELLEKSWNKLICQVNLKMNSYGQAVQIRMGTTMVVLLIVGSTYYIGNVGDSRAYHMKDELTLITKDQTLIQREIDSGRMTYEEACKDKRKNVLLQCVGASKVVNPDYYTGNVKSGMMFLLCSDGFHHVIGEKELYQYLTPYEVTDEQTMKQRLLYLTEMSKYRQETDNISAALIRVE